jgi:hypothetical protein
LIPSGILHITAFVTLCEGYMGIEPHFSLWNYFFRAQLRHGSNAEKAVLGSLDIYVRGPEVDPYFLIPMLNPPVGRPIAWFLLRDDGDTPLLAFIGSRPVPHPDWGYGVPQTVLCSGATPSRGCLGIVAKVTNGRGDSADLFQPWGPTASSTRSERVDAFGAKLS